MSHVLPVAGAAATFIGLLILAIFQDLISEEARVRLERLPFAILRLAALQMPAELREEIYRNHWLPDLEFQLSEEAGAGPITRVIAANRWALSMLVRRGGSRIARELYAGIPPNMRGFEDIRLIPRSRRKQFDARAVRLNKLCQHPPANFDETALAKLASDLAIACEALVDARAEREAVALAIPLLDRAHPITMRLGFDHPALLAVRRSYAHGLVQLGHARAEALLRELHEEEARLYGHQDPRTFPTLQLLWWAVMRAGRLEEAKAGLLALEALMVRLPNPKLALLRHVQCKRNWIQGELREKHEATQGYRQVARDRSDELGASHADTIDSIDSMGKMLVRNGDGIRGLKILRAVYAERRRLQGRRHTDAQETAKHLALAHALAHPSVLVRRRALRRLRRILKVQIRVRGADHPNTLDTEQLLAKLVTLLEKR
ncbi:hypothetical protein [Acrocarpospora catenulata]|uniref:hypothetical protein n=1 Tax=Acrocarpospora catenulata TaxID=2836182 RepID=UPI001BDB1CAD|nr:hypothetical protein [Acrocarpospora catenulata]